MARVRYFGRRSPYPRSSVFRRTTDPILIMRELQDLRLEYGDLHPADRLLYNATMRRLTHPEMRRSAMTDPILMEHTAEITRNRRLRERRREDEATAIVLAHAVNELRPRRRRRISYNIDEPLVSAEQVREIVQGTSLDNYNPNTDMRPIQGELEMQLNQGLLRDRPPGGGPVGGPVPQRRTRRRLIGMDTAGVPLFQEDVLDSEDDL